MSNFDRAVKALNDVDEALDHLADNEAYVTALAAAGLLKTEFEESELSRLYGMEMVVERGIRKGWLNECEFEDFL